MKKLLALFLVLAMMLSVALVACSDNTTTSGNNDNFEDDGDDDGFVSITDNNNNDTNSNDTGNGGGNTVVDTEWNVVSYSVYAMCEINIRKGASSKAETLGTVPAKTSLNAIAKSTDEDDCWFKINYDGDIYYVDGDYVTTNSNEANFTTLAEEDQFELTVKTPADPTKENQVNLRKLPTFDSDYPKETVKTSDTATNKMKVVGMNDTKNWYIVEYKGETYYLAVNANTKPYLEGLPSTGGNSGPVGG